MRPSLARVLAAVMAMASPMSAGIPPLDTGTRDYELTLAGPAPRRRRERRAAGLIPVEECVAVVPDEVQRELLDKAAQKRARRAARGW